MKWLPLPRDSNSRSTYAGAGALAYIVSGALRFLLGEKDEHEIVVRAGEVLVIPSNLPHSAFALEDTVDVDIFCPPREDWLNGTDAYLRTDTLPSRV